MQIAILGGGISGLTAAYELQQARQHGADLDWRLYEASDRLGGIIQTTRIPTPAGDYILEGGPDGWITEKPWATDLALELGLENEIIHSNDATRKTWVIVDGQLQAIPDGLRMMVPTNLNALEDSPLFSEPARLAYAREAQNGAELKRSAPDHDESVASFVRRHFGQEVLRKVGAPLLSGVFGGDVEVLSVRSVMPQFVAMEREYGSLIAALQASAQQRGAKPRQPIFTSLKRGMASLVDAIVASLPQHRLHTGCAASDIRHLDSNRVALTLTSTDGAVAAGAFDHLIVALPLDAVRLALAAPHKAMAELLPAAASSATLVAFAWPRKFDSGRPLQQITVPAGFGVLNPQQNTASLNAAPSHRPQLLAVTFVDQKFPCRAPDGSKVLRVFFGSGSTEAFAHTTDAHVASAALEGLRSIMGPLPDPDPTITTVRRLPRSLPQYEIGHQDRIAELDKRLANTPGLHLLGNAYRGVGLPDLIRDARSTAQSLIAVAPKT
jgi:oxygen-dependent protoporphyrinogen oxidase